MSSDLDMMFMHCVRCIPEAKLVGKTPKEYARLNVAALDDVLKVVCTRHDIIVGTFHLAHPITDAACGECGRHAPVEPKPRPISKNQRETACEAVNLLNEWLRDSARFPAFRQIGQRTRDVIDRAKEVGI